MAPKIKDKFRGFQKTENALLFIVYCYRRASAIAEGDDTEENVFSQGPLGKPPRHYTILAQSTRSRYTRNIWPEPLMGYLWGWHVTEKAGIISACKTYIISHCQFFIFVDYLVDVLVFLQSWFDVLCVLGFWVTSSSCVREFAYLSGVFGFWGSQCCHLYLLDGPVERGQTLFFLPTIARNPLRGFRLILLVFSSVF